MSAPANTNWLIKVSAAILAWVLKTPLGSLITGIASRILNIPAVTVERYINRSWPQWSVKTFPTMCCIFAVIALLLVLKLFGFLNRGNGKKYGASAVAKKADSPLKGRKIIFLGSSVTRGMAAQGVSFVDMVAAATGAEVVKEAVSGTTLVDKGNSYIKRLKALKDDQADLFVCQLSTNDATKNFALADVRAAIEEVIDYVRSKWNCPIVFYTNPEYPSVRYAEMVEELKKIAAEKNVEVIDLWNDAEVNSKENKKRSFMNDKIHPTKKGYQLWTPIMVEALEAVAQGKHVPARAVKAPAPTKEALKKKKTGRTVGKTALVALCLVLLFAVHVALASFGYLSDAFGQKHPGNAAQYHSAALTLNPDSPLKGKTILGLGSSVMAGWQAGLDGPGEMFSVRSGANYIREVRTGTSVTTTADGTSLDGQETYYPRLRYHNAQTDPQVDLVIVQLGTNDCADWVVVGELNDLVSLNPDDYDDHTFTGAVEAMIAYTISTWGPETKFIMYSNTRFTDKNVEKYDQMTANAQKIMDKWHDAGYETYLLDMWNDEALNDINNYSSYGDVEYLWNFGEIHPRAAGYSQWWEPFWEEHIYALYQ